MNTAQVSDVLPQFGDTAEFALGESEAYVEIGKGEVAWMNLVCSGDRLPPA